MKTSKKQYFFIMSLLAVSYFSLSLAADNQSGQASNSSKKASSKGNKGDKLPENILNQQVKTLKELEKHIAENNPTLKDLFDRMKKEMISAMRYHGNRKKLQEEKEKFQKQLQEVKKAIGKLKGHKDAKGDTKKKTTTVETELNNLVSEVKKDAGI